MKTLQIGEERGFDGSKKVNVVNGTFWYMLGHSIEGLLFGGKAV